jgi:hypothetical protein
MTSITKLFGSYGYNTKLDSFNDEMKFFWENVNTGLVWCGLCWENRASF